MSALFSPIKLRGLDLANRIMVAPMCQYSSVDGEATDWHITHLSPLALAGAASSSSKQPRSSPPGVSRPAASASTPTRTKPR